MFLIVKEVDGEEMEELLRKVSTVLVLWCNVNAVIISDRRDSRNRPL